MKTFLYKVIVFVILALSSMLLVFCLADGSTDALYLKFTSSKQASLIVGSSRAQQGVLPDVLNERMNNISIYNYAFSIAFTPYGKPYYESIQKKIDATSKTGIFLVCVNPWTISSVTPNPEDSLEFRERGSFIDKTHFVNLNPNLEYMIESYNSRNIDIFYNKSRVGDYQTFFLHNNGWLEVTIESDLISVKERHKKKLNDYKQKLRHYSGFSKHRFNYLKKTITLMQEHGKVYLVRLPVHDNMYELEQELMVDFDEKMHYLSEQYSVPYINAVPDRALYSYTDGHHLDIPSGKRFSEYLVNQIEALH